MIRRVAVVANSRAGALLDGPGAGTLEAAFLAAGLEPLFIPPEAGTLPERMAQAVALQPDAVVAAGGDGTVACASMLGLPAQLGRTREQTRGGGVRAGLRMARAAWRQLVRARRLRVTMLADGTPLALDAAALTVTVNPLDPASGRTFGAGRGG